MTLHCSIVDSISIYGNFRTNSVLRARDCCVYVFLVYGDIYLSFPCSEIHCFHTRLPILTSMFLTKSFTFVQVLHSFIVPLFSSKNVVHSCFLGTSPVFRWRSNAFRTAFLSGVVQLVFLHALDLFEAILKLY